MEILEDNVLNELKTKFNELDIHDEHFTEKVNKIVDDILLKSKDKIGTEIESKTIDEAYTEEMEGFQELEDLKNEGVLDAISDEVLRNTLESQAINKIIDEDAEKQSLEDAGFQKEPSKPIKKEDIVEEILKQLEEFMNKKEEEIQKKIEENEQMMQKVMKREELKASRTKVNNLHQKTKEYKGTEGKALNKNVETAIEDLDKQLLDLIRETSRDGNEIQDSELQEENKKLQEEKKALADMFKNIKKEYTEDKCKKVDKVIFQSEIKTIMDEIQFGMNPYQLLDKAEAIREIYVRDKANFDETELTEILKNMPLNLEKELDKDYSAYDLMLAGSANAIRREYIKTQNKEEKTDEDKEILEKCKKSFNKKSEFVGKICDGREVLPLRSEEQYLEQLDELAKEAKDESGILLGKGKKAKEANKIVKELRRVLQTVIGVVNVDKMEAAYNKVVDNLMNNNTMKKETLPKDLVQTRTRTIKVEKVEVVPLTPIDRETEDRTSGDRTSEGPEFDD